MVVHETVEDELVSSDMLFLAVLIPASTTTTSLTTDENHLFLARHILDIALFNVNVPSLGSHPLLLFPLADESTDLFLEVLKEGLRALCTLQLLPQLSRHLSVDSLGILGSLSPLGAGTRGTSIVVVP